MQPLAPCALSLEGTVLGASQITWVGGRTVLSAIVALSFFSLVSSQGWALPGIWAGELTQPQHLMLYGPHSVSMPILPHLSLLRLAASVCWQR